MKNLQNNLNIQEIQKNLKIRILGTIARTHAFQACTFNHSVTSPSLTILPENARNMNCALLCVRLIKNVVFYTIFIG